MNEREFANVMALPAPRRYAYFIKRVADWHELWSLKEEDGWLLASDDQGQMLIPVWPHAKYAEACASGVWEGAKAQAIDLSDWLERWTIGMIHDQRMVAVFPIPSDRGIVVSPQRLQDDLEAELSRFE